MSGTIQDFATAVNNVIGTNRDAEQGYRAAADAAQDRSLKDLFEELTLQRGRFAEEVQAAVKDLGFDPIHPAGLTGVLLGAWMVVKGAFSEKGPHAILTEVERGERWSIKTYQDALAANLPPQIRTVLDRQFAKIEEAHNRIVELRQASEPPQPPPPPPPAAPPPPAETTASPSEKASAMDLNDPANPL